MDIYKVIIVLILVLKTMLVSGQESFETIIPSEQKEVLYYTFQTSNQKYISIGFKQEGFNTAVSPLIYSLDENGEVEAGNSIQKPDTSYSFQYGIEKANGNYLVFGNLTDSVSPFDFNVVYICELSPELELIWEKMHPIPVPYNNHFLINFLMMPDSNIILQGRADSSMYSYNRLLYTMLIDQNGNMIDFNFYEGWKDSGIYNEMVFNHDSSSIYFFGEYARNLTSKIEWIQMDLDLNIIDYKTYLDYDHLIGSPVSVKMMPNGNIVMANMAIVEPGTNQDLYIRVMDPELNSIHDNILYYPEHVYLAVNKGLAFIDPNMIWVTTFEGSFPSTSGTEVFRVHIFDENLNLKSVKEFGGDNRYWFYNLIMTSDGGCLLTGVVPDTNGSWNSNGYLIKIMPGDILTFAEETIFNSDKDVIVFPNPFSDFIYLQTTRDGLSFHLYDIKGDIIHNSEIKAIPNYSIKTDDLKPGFYFYTIQSENQIIQSGKLIKE